ncbi:MAG: hypothetical protein Alpg2KO_20730 [Alphaproteobacteria bacterium]
MQAAALDLLHLPHQCVQYGSPWGIKARLAGIVEFKHLPDLPNRRYLVPDPGTNRQSGPVRAAARGYRLLAGLTNAAGGFAPWLWRPCGLYLCRQCSAGCGQSGSGEETQGSAAIVQALVVFAHLISPHPPLTSRYPPDRVTSRLALLGSASIFCLRR